MAVKRDPRDRLGRRNVRRLGPWLPQRSEPPYHDRDWHDRDWDDRRDFRGAYTRGQARLGDSRSEFELGLGYGPRPADFQGVRPATRRIGDQLGYGSFEGGYGGYAGQRGGYPPEQPLGTARPHYRGRGPIGWHRSDDRVREEVCERLTEDPSLDPSGVEVTVKDGEVTISGTVDTRRDKRHAERIAEAVLGVRDVHNRLCLRQRET